MSAWSLISNDNCFLILITNPFGQRGLSCLFITHGLTNIGAYWKTNWLRQKWIILAGLTTIPFFASLLADCVLLDNWSLLLTNIWQSWWLLSLACVEQCNRASSQLFLFFSKSFIWLTCATGLRRVILETSAYVVALSIFIFISLNVMIIIFYNCLA